MELFLQTEVLLALALVAVIAGFLDTLAGGGGLIVIPALLLAQVPPVAAIATNKLQGTFGTFTAALTMVRKQLVAPRTIRRGFILAFAGSVTGAVTIQHIPAAMVKVIVPLVLTAIALYFLVSRDRGDEAAAPRMEGEKFDATVVPAVGFYDGAFGPGAGSFYTLGNAALLGRSIVSATAHAKVLNFASNLAALVIFALGGKVLWVVGSVMVAGSMLGAYAGSLVVINKGNRVIRPAIVTMSLVMLCAYVLKSYGPD